MATRTQANGVLAITPAHTSGNAARPASAKPATIKLKIIIRRLAPGLTEEEFKSVLGEEWKLGQGKVDWFRYKPGKESKDASKPSRPSRAYLHLTNEAHLLSLSDLVRQSVFEDAQNTFNSTCLIGPPTVEFAPYSRIPSGRRRIDNRAGVIDQDPEFMAFLEELANPTSAKETNGDSHYDLGTAKQEKVTMTPLVQALKDKKAIKNKDLAARSAKRQEANIAKGKSIKDSLVDDSKKKGKDAKMDRLVDKAAKEAVKILNREAASKSSAASPSSPGSTASTSATPKLDVGKIPGRQRQAVVAAHIRMLQRDLGLSPAQAHRQVRRDTADAQKAEKAAAADEAVESKENNSPRSQQTQSVPTAPKATLNPANNRKGRSKGPSSENEAAKSTAANKPLTPMVLLKKPEAQPANVSATSGSIAQNVKPAPPVTVRRLQQVAAPAEGATQAFVKHANPSQGVTETLLKEAMEKYGAVRMVEIDKRKGFAYVDFVDTDGLKKAMAANPITVAQGTVQVMQRKGTALPPEKKSTLQAPKAPLSSRGGRGGRGGTAGRRGGRGGGRGGFPTLEPAKAPASAPTGPAK